VLKISPLLDGLDEATARKVLMVAGEFKFNRMPEQQRRPAQKVAAR